MRLRLPLSVCFLCGLFMTIQFFVPYPAVTGTFEEILLWMRIVGIFALVIGIGTLMRLHWGRIKRRSANWGYSTVTLVGLAAMASIGLVGGIEPGSPYMWIFEYVQSPMDATMFSLLAFFIASAAYRAFRARTLDATLLLIAAIIVMFGRVPIGNLLWQHIAPQMWVDKVPFLPAVVTDWILDVPNMAAKRGILLGVSLGIIATSLKIMLGIERAYLGGGA